MHVSNTKETSTDGFDRDPLVDNCSDEGLPQNQIGMKSVEKELRKRFGPRDNEGNNVNINGFSKYVPKEDRPKLKENKCNERMNSNEDTEDFFDVHTTNKKEENISNINKSKSTEVSHSKHYEYHLLSTAPSGEKDYQLPTNHLRDDLSNTSSKEYISKSNLKEVDEFFHEGMKLFNRNSKQVNFLGQNNSQEFALEESSSEGCLNEEENLEIQERLIYEDCGKGSPKKENSHLLHYDDMPEHLQFNPYIQTGYRPMLSVWGCFSSLFYIHNETFNIVTHGIPILYIIVTAPSVTNWERPELRFLSWCHITGSVCPWIGSCIYHLFMNLDRDEQFYHKLLRLDMLGIWICQSFGAMPMVFAFTHCFSKPLKWCCISFYSVVSLWGLYKAMLAISPWERRLCFLLPFCIRITLCGFRFFRFGGGDPNALLDLTLQDLVAVVGAVIGALHIPEKWFPGLVDNCWNSHNIMHILVVAAVYSMHKATMKDLFWMDTIRCDS